LVGAGTPSAWRIAAMSSARPILPGRFYLLTRRCSQRQFLLRPDDKTNQAFLYCLGEAAERFGIELVGWLAMSNHYHAAVHDPHGRLPDFVCHFHQMLAKCLNARWSRWENLWSSEPPTYTLLVDASDVFDKLLYTLLNPVVEHLVDSVGHWPGASSWSLLDGREVTINRPMFFFRRDGAMPLAVRLKTVVPPGAADGMAQWAARVRDAVAAHEREIRARRIAKREPLLGRKGVRAASAFDKPNTPAPRRQLRPFVACKNLWRRICALDALERFRAAYSEARRAFAAGRRDVVFPAGTFALRRLGVLCGHPA
jgi:REP element-mobilizing transposase RayT